MSIAPGPNALSADPLFATAPFGDYCLAQTAAGQPGNSPCLDAGDTLTATAPLDLDSLIHAWTTRTDSVADAGAIDIGYHYSLETMTGITELPARPGTPPAIVARPNPATGSHVRLAGPLGRTVTVYDASGRVALRQQLSREVPVLDIGRLGAGVYIIRTERQNCSSTGRLVVQR